MHPSPQHHSGLPVRPPVTEAAASWGQTWTGAWGEEPVPQPPPPPVPQQRATGEEKRRLDDEWQRQYDAAQAMAYNLGAAQVAEARQREEAEAVRADLRYTLVVRLGEMSGRHAALAYERQDTPRELGPHAIAVHYAQPDREREELQRKRIEAQRQEAEERSWERSGEIIQRGRDLGLREVGNVPAGSVPGYAWGLEDVVRPWLRTRSATRVLLPRPDVVELVDVLSCLREAVIYHRSRGPVDVRDSRIFATDVERNMRNDAHLIGISVSTLDAPGQPWSLTRTSQNGLGIPGRTITFLNLDDGPTHMVVDRAATGRMRVRTTKTLNSHPLRPPIEYEMVDAAWPRWDGDLQRTTGPDLPPAPVWEALYRLYTVVNEAHRSLLAASRRAQPLTTNTSHLHDALKRAAPSPG